MPTVETLVELVEPVVRARRCSLYDLELLGSGPTQILRIYIDREGGVDTDTCATVSRLLSRALDEADAIPGRYTLEVSSPGLERVLRRPDHYAAVAGQGVTARVKVRSEGATRVVEGTVTDAGDEAFRLETPAGDTVDVPYTAVVSARTVFAWGAGQRQGARK